MHAIGTGSIAIHNLYRHQFLNEYLLPTILDSFIIGYANITSILKGVKGGGEPQRGEGWWGASKRQANPLCKVKTAKWHQLVLFSVLNPCPTSPAICVVIYSRLAACLGEMESFKDHLSTRGCLTKLRNKPQQKQPGKLSALLPA